MKKKKAAVLTAIILVAVVCLIAFVGMKYAGESSENTQPAVSDTADESGNDDIGDPESETDNLNGADAENEEEIISDSADESGDDDGDSESETGNFNGLDVEDEGEINLEEGQGIVIE